MAKADKANRLKARLPKGFRDVEAEELRGLKRMLRTIEDVYESYGFEPVETPFVEYTDALGKFLPDQDRPNEGVFSFQDDDEQWLSLRYDLTAPLARYVAENFERLPKPYRSYRSGWVFRNEKPGPGRFRQFMQFDADTVGTSSPAADAEVCMMAADTLEQLGVPRGQYVIRVNNRKILDGVMETIGLAGDENAGRRLTVLRAIDKLDRLGQEGVSELLGEGRRDESGDFTKGAGLNADSIQRVMQLFTHASDRAPDFFKQMNPDEVMDDDDLLPGSKSSLPLVIANPSFLDDYERQFPDMPRFLEGLNELRTISDIVRTAGYGTKRIRITTSVVRGLEYYTGPVFEAELLFEVKDDEGRPVRFGSVGGGGRYDGLVERFRGESVPATGFSMGVSRLYAALKALGRAEESAALAPVVVLVMDRERIGDYQRIVSSLRNAGVRAELYLGTAGMKAQMKYADRRGSPLVVIQGEDERQRGEVTLKDLVAGAAMAESVESREEWRDARPAQVSVKGSDLVPEVKRILARQRDA